MGEFLVELLIDLLVDQPIVGAVLLTLLLWLVCVALMGGVVGSGVAIVCGLLIFALLHWRSKQRFISLGLRRPNGSAPEEGAAGRVRRHRTRSSPARRKLR